MPTYNYNSYRCLYIVCGWISKKPIGKLRGKRLQMISKDYRIVYRTTIFGACRTTRHAYYTYMMHRPQLSMLFNCYNLKYVGGKATVTDRLPYRFALRTAYILYYIRHATYKVVIQFMLNRIMITILSSRCADYSSRVCDRVRFPLPIYTHTVHIHIYSCAV